MALPPIPGLQFSSTRVSSSSSLNSVIAPAFNISTAGPASGSAGGTATGSAASNASGDDGLPSFLPSGAYPTVGNVARYDSQGQLISPTKKVSAAGIFSDPIIWVVVAGGAYLLFAGPKG